MTKQEVRSEIARRVKNLSPVYCQEADEAICRLVVQSELCKAAQTVFCYAGSEREIDTTGLLHARGTASMPGERRYGGPAH